MSKIDQIDDTRARVELYEASVKISKEINNNIFEIQLKSDKALDIDHINNMIKKTTLLIHEAARRTNYKKNKSPPYLYLV